MSDEKRVRWLIKEWLHYRATPSDPTPYCRLKDDLYQARNPGFNGAPPIGAWPARLVDPDDAIMAAVEHYFLTRCWVGTGVFPAWQMRAMRDIYDLGKHLGLTPRHNPDNPTTPPSALQRRFQNEGIRDGEQDLAASGASPPVISAPPQYW